MALETGRQLLHLVIGLGYAAIIYFDLFPTPVFGTLLAVALVLSVLSKKIKIPLVSFLLERYEREKDKAFLPGRGFITFLASCILATIIFEQETAFLAVLTLAIGDSFSHLFGIWFGKYRNPLNHKKYVEGFVGAVILNTLCLTFFISWWMALTVSFIAFVIESLDFSHYALIDDNLVVPLVAGILLRLLLAL